jgi:8-oxo-dGTP pyrophosphatase MutT (NUDIX family)
MKTRGVRVILKRRNEIFLVKHPYDNFWVFPGGGIQKNETAEAAAIREAAEETPYLISEPVVKLGEYKNCSKGKNDTVTIFVAENFVEHYRKHRLVDEIEIQKSGWFEITKLPNISVATRKRIIELQHRNFSAVVRDWN